MTALIKINDKLSVAGQIALEDFAVLAGLGFKAVINNRPEGEEPTQPASAEEAAAAADAGLFYAHIPVTGPSIREQDVRALQAVLAKSDGPVLAHCRSGTRSLTLFAIGEVLDGRLKREDLPAFGAEHGIDMRGADAWLARQGH
ncbi:MAG: TIGR01244 family sulfur transferase [Candidatus Kaistia colombiensis]|nr:MAG: TIGR01244 family sulfur transferase [Kaistia sp.]